MKTFRHSVTGKLGTYPDHFEDYPDFIPCDPEPCTDCQPEEPESEFLLDEDTEEEDPEW